MKIQIESTTKVVTVNGIPARIWEGKTASGIEIHAFITRIAVRENSDQEQFGRELQECRQPSAEIAAYPDRLVL